MNKNSNRNFQLRIISKPKLTIVIFYNHNLQRREFNYTTLHDCKTICAILLKLLDYSLNNMVSVGLTIST